MMHNAPVTGERVFRQLDKAYERHAIREQRLRLAGRVDEAEVHHAACVVLLHERIANEDADKTPLRPARVDCDFCAIEYGVDPERLRR